MNCIKAVFKKLFLEILLIFLCLITFSNKTFANDANLLKLHYNRLLNELIHHNTPGYKRNDIVKLDKIYYMEQGSLRQTDSSSDFAVVGNGFFKLYDDKNDKVYYTRSGSFEIRNNFLRNKDGYRVLPALEFKGKRIIPRYKIENDNTLQIYSYNTALNKGEWKKYEFTLYIPKTKKIERFGEYFIFTSVQKSKNFKIYNRCLEMSTVDAIPVLLMMMDVVKQIEEHKSTDKKEVQHKLFLLQKLLEYSLQKNAIQQLKIDINILKNFLSNKFGTSSQGSPQEDKVFNYFLPFLKLK